MKTGEMSKTRSSLTTLTSPLCNPSTARALHEVRYRKVEPELHVFKSISSRSVLLFVTGLAHISHIYPRRADAVNLAAVEGILFVYE